MNSRPCPARSVAAAAAALLGAALMPAALAADGYEVVPLDLFAADGDLEVALWAQSPMLLNPTNMDIDKDGRIWVAEGVNYRRHGNRRPEGDRIMVLEDTDGDGKADASHVFVQEEFLTAPLGVAVLDNKVVVSMTPDLIVYTDVDRDLKFDPAVDKREVLLTGFNNKQHDHTLHSVTAGPDGRWYFNHGNCGAVFTDKSGKTFRLGSAYQNQGVAGQKSDDGHVYIGAGAYRMNPDGTGVQCIGHNFRNSYEQTVTSFGDVFQNDNDDPPACRVAFLLEFGNAGFCSADGKRAWKADMRPGQTTAVAEWRQEDPGTMPAGDVYGGGSPTGICYYEGGALGDGYAGGLLLSCEPARNTVFGYKPVPDGAGYKLERFDFLTTNAVGEFAGADFKGGKVNRADIKTLFRPSDVAVGPDGAIYVADWYDPRVGGHADLDDTLSGAIYRVAPKGFKPSAPKIDAASTEGQIAALKSHAVNVRNIGFAALKAQGAKAIPAVKPLLLDANPFVRGRAIFLLAQLGPEGIAAVETLLRNGDPMVRLAAFRALRREGSNVVAHAEKMAADESPALRREAALAMRDVPAAQALPVLEAVAAKFGGEDRWYLDAIGIGASGKEADLFASLSRLMGGSDPLKWSPAFAKIAWRLTPDAATAAFAKRAVSPALSAAERKAAVTALAFIGTKEAAMGVLEAAGSDGPAKAEALWWCLTRGGGEWQKFGIEGELKARGIYDPAKVELVEIVSPEPPKSTLPPAAEIAKLKGDPAKGKVAAARCVMCHRLGDTGIDVGPPLAGWANTQTHEVVVRSILDPSADIAHGFDAYRIKTKDGIEIDGLLLSDGNPTMILSMGGKTQTVPKGRVASQKKLGRSLMMTPEQLALTAQDIADIAAYLKTL